DLARAGRRIERPLVRLFLEGGDSMILVDGGAPSDHEREAEDRHPDREPEGHLRFLPERAGGLLPRLGLAARLEEPQSRVHSLRQSDLVQQLRMLTAQALEIRCALQRQPPRQIALDNLVPGNEVPIHGRGGGRRWCGRGWRGRGRRGGPRCRGGSDGLERRAPRGRRWCGRGCRGRAGDRGPGPRPPPSGEIRRLRPRGLGDRKSTRLNSSHRTISYAVFCLKKKNTKKNAILPKNYSLTFLYFLSVVVYTSLSRSTPTTPPSVSPRQCTNQLHTNILAFIILT